jgi:hypothetical protein
MIIIVKCLFCKQLFILPKEYILGMINYTIAQEERRIIEKPDIANFHKCPAKN